MDYSTLPSRLKNSLIASGEKQTHFAQCAGVHDATFSYFLNGYKGRRTQTAKRIADEMERRGWLQEIDRLPPAFTLKPVSEDAVKEFHKENHTLEILNSNLSAEAKLAVLRSLSRQ